MKRFAYLFTGFILGLGTGILVMRNVPLREFFTHRFTLTALPEGVDMGHLTLGLSTVLLLLLLGRCVYLGCCKPRRRAKADDQCAPEIEQTDQPDNH